MLLPTKPKAHTGITLSIPLCGCESRFLAVDLAGALVSWRHARLREMCRVTMHQVWIHRITINRLYERRGVVIEHYIRVRYRIDHVARMDKTRVSRRLFMAWVANSRFIGAAYMTYGGSLERWLKHADA